MFTRLTLLVRLSAGLLLTSALSACHLGDLLEHAGLSSSRLPVQAPGLYGGQSNDLQAPAVVTLIQPGLDFWSFQGQWRADGLVLKGFVQGSGSQTADGFRSADAVDYGVMPPQRGSLGAAFDGASQGWNGTRHHGDRWVDFDTQRLIRTQPMPPDALPGLWQLQDHLGHGLRVHILPDGRLSGRSSNACTFSGQLSLAQVHGYSYPLAIQYGPPPCLMAGETIRGIALLIPLTDGRQQLILGGVNPERSMGSAAAGSRS